MAGDPFKVDWTSKQDVIIYAEKLGPGMVVYKHPNRRNYNITHHNRFLINKEYHVCQIIHLT